MFKVISYLLQAMGPTPATPIRTPTERRLGLGGPRLGGPVQAQSPSKRLRLGPSLSQTPKTEEAPKLTKAASSATFHDWKDVDLIVRSNEVEDDDDLNEGFCHYSIVDDE